ncbi:phosphoribosylaminoimidazolesuccinocarboxamide synthase [Fructilactobacillus cliffordii]|uniref:phosphoribosylaminoimidazolesuccinocarboxamide synthase n=1 Tax=Fructilactobacillus cliffordii TaxID=2940299 RepID=UPI0020927304|nr:phosphoribosylaminoimidazolesuccinocarboxamide synthase [Fructilactobacillus cliffordii]USS86240.1 phosphoribosylaminoimidazolesuccinocarboxamide synthase [Fructilactobacillus cliffordii]
MKITKPGQKIAEGKTKVVYATEDPNLVWLHSKDQVTALNGKKHDDFANKGALANQISTLLFQYLNDQGFQIHFVEQINATDDVVQKLTMLPVEVVVRNRAAGHFVIRFGAENLQPLNPPVQEFYYKSDQQDDPMINPSQLEALQIATPEESQAMEAQARALTKALTNLFAQSGMQLVDIKYEFGRNQQGELILGDELSPDNMRIIDQATGQSLDKDVYRHDNGDLQHGYQTVLDRLTAQLGEA